MAEEWNRYFWEACQLPKKWLEDEELYKLLDKKLSRVNTAKKLRTYSKRLRVSNETASLDSKSRDLAPARRPQIY